MAITENDVRLYASERMTDFADGGGAMSPTVVVDGLDNNVFPDVTDVDRLTGRSSLRKVFGAVVSADTDTYLSAHALLDDAADDSAIDALLLVYGGYATERAALVAALADSPIGRGPVGGGSTLTGPSNFGAITATSGSASVAVSVFGVDAGLTSPLAYLQPGKVVSCVVGGIAYLRTIVSSTGWAQGGSFYTGTITVDAAIPVSGPGYLYRPVYNHPRAYGVGLSAAGASTGATSISVNRVMSRVVPVALDAPYYLDGGPAPVTTVTEYVSEAYSYSKGLVMSTAQTTVSSKRVFSRTGQDITGFTYISGSVETGTVTPLFINAANGAMQIDPTDGFGAGSTPTLSSIQASYFPVTLRVTTSVTTTASGGGFGDTQGQAQVIQPLDPLLIHSTLGMAPATVANAQVVTTGRTTLARLRVIGNNGVEHARFTRGVPAPTGVGCTADLTAGTVTFTNVAGMSQPVTVEHRIEEMAMATAVSVGTGVITLNRALSRAFAAGTKVSSLCMRGDLQGRVIGGFAQTAWTGVFSDALLGGAPTADFNGAVYPIVTTNAGAIADRWLITFTNTTTFRCTGELTGEISGGSTGAAYAPINPATGAPYFTIPALGWGSGWSASNVYRFNTSGANAPLWVLRTVAPSAPSSASDSVTVEFRGYVNT